MDDEIARARHRDLPHGIRPLCVTIGGMTVQPGAFVRALLSQCLERRQIGDSLLQLP